MHPLTNEKLGPVRWEEFIELPDVDRRELIEGFLEEGEVPTTKHEWIVSLLIHFLQAWALPRKAGAVLASGVKVRIDDRRGVMPDVLFVRTGNGRS